MVFILLGLVLGLGALLYMAFILYVPLGILLIGIILFTLGLLIGGYRR